MRFNRLLLTCRNILSLFACIDGKKKHGRDREKDVKNHTQKNVEMVSKARNMTHSAAPTLLTIPVRLQYESQYVLLGRSPSTRRAFP